MERISVINSLTNKVYGYTSIINQNSSKEAIIDSYCMVKNWYSIRNQVIHSGLKFVSQDLVTKVRIAICYLVYELLGFSSKYLTIEELCREAFPIQEDLFTSIVCQK